jgi:hypothetical protein
VVIPIEKHKAVAVGIYFSVVMLIWLRNVEQQVAGAAVVLGCFLFLIVFSRFFARLTSWGFMEFFASDHGRGVPSGLAAFFFWLLFIIAIMLFVFGWSLY